MRIFHLGLMVAPPPNDSARKAFIANCDDYKCKDDFDWDKVFKV